VAPLPVRPPLTERRPEDGEDLAGEESFELTPYGYRWFRVGGPASGLRDLPSME
jgi:hypothetical protein